MPSLAEMKKIPLMSLLSDDMLKRVIPLITEERRAPEQNVFTEGDPANGIFMLLRGKALLNMSASSSVSVSVSAIDPGDTFGWSAILGRTFYTATAACVEDSVFWRLPGKEFLGLLNQDPTMGYLVMEFLAKILNDRLEKRTTQLFKTLLENIEMICNQEEVG
ncbi:MAG: cyclic nucleotide-binding domain-containing protein [Desulfatibacillum sp.]|nr:cyclic nucleotide-binding domain-containing protein [Desulfatibacillum sp.]